MTRALVVPAWIGFMRLTSAQSDPIASGASQFDAPPAMRQLDVSTVGSGSALAPQAQTPAAVSWLKWGPVTAHPSLFTRFTYGNGIQARPGHQVTTVQEEFSPSILLNLGSHWNLLYTPTLDYYSSHELKDTLAHNVSLIGGVVYGDWVFGLSQVYSSTSTPLIETGQQTEVQNFITGLTASYYFNTQMKLDMSVTQGFREASQFNSSRSWSTMEWLNYQLAPRVAVSAGVGGGYDDVTVGSDMTNEQIQGRITTRIANKLDFSFNGGVEIRQFETGSGDDLVNPIFGTTIEYHPFDFTTLTVAGKRAVSASLFQDQVTETSDISAAVRQRLLGILYLSLSFDFRNTSYLTTTTLSSGRQDETERYMARLSYQFLERGTAAVYYSYTVNDSNLAGFSFQSHQVGLELGYHF